MLEPASLLVLRLIIVHIEQCVGRRRDFIWTNSQKSLSPDEHCLPLTSQTFTSLTGATTVQIYRQAPIWPLKGSQVLQRHSVPFSEKGMELLLLGLAAPRNLLGSFFKWPPPKGNINRLEDNRQTTPENNSRHSSAFQVQSNGSSGTKMVAGSASISIPMPEDPGQGVTGARPQTRLWESLRYHPREWAGCRISLSIFLPHCRCGVLGWSPRLSYLGQIT